MLRLKLLAILCFALMWASVSDAACTGGSPTWLASSASRNDVNDCVGAASTGDKILIPAGIDNSTWTTPISLPTNKDLSITGAGIGKTIITCFSPTCLNIPNSRNYAVSGFDFTGNSNFILIRLDAPVRGKSFRIHHNRFTRTGGGYGSIDVIGEPVSTCASATTATDLHPTGLIDNNQFIDVRIFVGGTACAGSTANEVHAQNVLWAQHPRPFSPNGAWPEIVYIEDNQFIKQSGLINFVDTNYGGRYVLRYNKIMSAAGIVGPYSEVHGKQGYNRPSQWKEIYGNLHSVGTENFFGLAYIRSGSGVVFKNRVGAAAQVMRLNNERSYSSPNNGPPCDGTSNWDGNIGISGYPCRDQIGRMLDNTLWTEGSAYDQNLVPVYFWNNYSGSETIQYGVDLNPTGTAMDKHIVQNREWYTENTNFNGTTGVGIGSISSRPSSCTTGVGYWATDEGEWNSRQDGTDGQLYTCTSTNTWTLYYKPFPYPHPLQTAAGANPPPLAPQNLQVK